MSDLVSRSYLLSEYDRQHEGPPGRARKIIEEAPSIEQETIKCKDCVHWIPFAINPHYCIFHDWVSGEDDYCSRAEGRTDE